MTDEKIKEAFESLLCEGGYTESEEDFAYSFMNTGVVKPAAFYAGFKAAERLAKIEVLEDVERAIMAMPYPNENPEELRVRDVLGYIERQRGLLKALDKGVPS